MIQVSPSDAQKQPVHPPELVEAKLREGLGQLPDGATVKLETHKLPSGVEHQLFFIRCFGREWHVSAEMSSTAALSTGEAIARMIAAVKTKGPS